MRSGGQSGRPTAQAADLDEPTNHLDVSYQHEVLTLVRSLKITTVAALHDLSLAARYCDRMDVMQDGGIVALGHPDQALTADLVASVFAVRLRRLSDPENGRPTWLSSGSDPSTLHPDPAAPP